MQICNFSARKTIVKLPYKQLIIGTDVPVSKHMKLLAFFLYMDFSKIVRTCPLREKKVGAGPYTLGLSLFYFIL